MHKGYQMIFTSEVGSIFEILGDAFLATLKDAKFSRATRQALAVDWLWSAAWQEVARVPN
jgi:hypothetical protein